MTIMVIQTVEKTDFPRAAESHKARVSEQIEDCPNYHKQQSLS